MSHTAHVLETRWERACAHNAYDMTNGFFYLGNFIDLIRLFVVFCFFVFVYDETSFNEDCANWNDSHMYHHSPLIDYQLSKVVVIGHWLWIQIDYWMHVLISSLIFSISLALSLCRFVWFRVKINDIQYPRATGVWCKLPLVNGYWISKVGQWDLID